MIATLRFGSVEVSPSAGGASNPRIQRANRTASTALERWAARMDRNGLGTGYLSLMEAFASGISGLRPVETWALR